MPFDQNSIPDVSGQIFVITGANSGIGFEAARLLIAHGARVVMACRDEAKMATAAAQLGESKVDRLQLDLASLASIRAAATKLAAMHPRIDVLVNNAGVMAIPSRTTADGFEMQFGTNHLGHFAFTGLVLPLLHDAGRVVTVSSIMHKFGKVSFEDLPAPRKYDSNAQYGLAKLSNLLYTYELDRRLRAAGSSTLSVACHPGYAATNLQGVGPQMTGSKFSAWVMKVANASVAQSAEMGALPTVYAATGRDIASGDYVGPTRLFETRGFPDKVKSSAASHDEAVARRLWDESEKWTGVTYAFAQPKQKRADG